MQRDVRTHVMRAVSDTRVRHAASVCVVFNVTFERDASMQCAYVSETMGQTECVSFATADQRHPKSMLMQRAAIHAHERER